MSTRIKQLPKKERTRLAILRATYDLLGKEEGNLTRIEDIMHRVDLTRATFYNHFESREQLFELIAFELTHHFNSLIQPHLSEYESIAIRASLATRYYLKQAWSDKKWGMAIINTSMYSSKLFGEETYNQATNTILTGTENKEFIIENTIAGRDMFLGTMLAAFLNILYQRAPETYIDDINLTIMRALGLTHERSLEISKINLKVINVPPHPFNNLN